jgi:predicted dehydrogenase
MVNIGVVGCGYWGAKHIRVFNEITEARVSAVCDLDKRRLGQVKLQYPYVAATHELEEVLNAEVDGVVIATPVDTHYRLAKEALLHNKNVLVEKPMTSSSQEAMELIELAERRNKVLMVGHTFLYHPAVDLLRKLVMDDVLGDIYYIDSARLNLGLFRSDVDVLWDLAPHDTSIVLHLIGDEPIAVSARGAGHVDRSVCDVAYMELRFDRELLVNIHVSWLDPCKVRRMIVVGSKKMAVYDDISDTEKVRIYDKGIHVPSDDEKLTAWLPSYRFGDVVIPFLSNAEPLKLECMDFVHSIAKGTKPLSDGWSGLRVVNVLEAAKKSLANGGRRLRPCPIMSRAKADSGRFVRSETK